MAIKEAEAGHLSFCIFCTSFLRYVSNKFNTSVSCCRSPSSNLAETLCASFHKYNLYHPCLKFNSFKQSYRCLLGRKTQKEIHMWFRFEVVSVTNIFTCVPYVLLSRNFYVWRTGHFCALSDKARLCPPGVFCKTCIISQRGELGILQGKCTTTSTLAHPSKWWV